MSDFWWFNSGNFHEWGGPFATAEEAKADAIASYKAIDRGSGPIRILKEVESALVTREFKWDLYT